MTYTCLLESIRLNHFFDVVDIRVAEDNLNSGLAHWANYQGSVLTLAFVRGENQTLLGTAVMVAPGIALAALHVIEEHRLQLADGTLSLVGCGASEYGLDLWRSWGCTPVSGTDLALISFDFAMSLTEKRKFGLLSLSERVLKLGEKVTVLGFRPEAHKFSETDLGTVSFSGHLRFGFGKVKQVFPDGRDRAMLPWPCFEIDCPAVGAMSGGPVLDKFGHVVGILCSSFSSIEDSGPSYASLISRALNVPVTGGWRSILSVRKQTTLSNLNGECCFIADAKGDIQRPET